MEINKTGIKEVLGIYVGENESSKFWLSVLNDIKNRGVKDILVYHQMVLQEYKRV